MKRHRYTCGLCGKGRLMDNERVLGSVAIHTPTVSRQFPSVCEQCEGKVVNLLAKLAGTKVEVKR